MKGPPLGPDGENITWPDQVAPRGLKASSTRNLKPQTSNLQPTMTYQLQRVSSKFSDKQKFFKRNSLPGLPNTHSTGTAGQGRKSGVTNFFSSTPPIETSDFPLSMNKQGNNRYAPVLKHSGTAINCL